MSDTERALIVAGIAAIATLGAALIAAVAAYLAGKRDRRRSLYGEAYKAALGWVELLYRVRRRTAESEMHLVDRFHDHQESLNFYVGWIAAESKYMSRSYGRLVKAVKGVTEPLITAAWNEGLRPFPGNAVPEDTHPDLTIESNRFLKDVRAHLSPWKFRKIAVAWRNRGGAP